MSTPVTSSKTITRHWHLIDLKDQILGRSASRIAQLLSGKTKIYFSPNLDSGDYVIAINAAQVKVTGKKLEAKKYYRHSGYPGGFKEETLAQKMVKDPRVVIEKAVKGMLPKNKFQQPRLRRLKVFTAATHPYRQHLVKNQA